MFVGVFPVRCHCTWDTLVLLLLPPPTALISALASAIFSPSRRRRLPPTLSSDDVMASFKKLARSLLQGGENARLLSATGPNWTAYMHYDNLPGKKKEKKTFYVIVSLSACVLLQAGTIRQLSERFP